jgi:NADH-quinone oxidoreductase subunit G
VETPETITITVNGRSVRATADQMLLSVLRGEGIDIPTLCHDERLAPYGGCRLCLVDRRDDGAGLVAACSTVVTDGMVIETDSEAVLEARRWQLHLLALDHRMDCPVCPQGGDCRLQDLIFRYGAPAAELPFERVHRPGDDHSALIVRDGERCILCGRCARLCDEIQGVAALGLVGRGAAVRIATFLDAPLDCEFCGQCVDGCPVGALVARPFAADVPAWRRTVTRTTCSFCSCGCELIVESDDGRPLRIRGDEHSSPNRGKLCAKGRFGWDLLESRERVTHPLVRRDGRLEAASWDEALSVTAAALRSARDRGSPIVGLGTPRLSLEDAYAFQRLVRSVLGSPHVDCGPGRGVRALVEGVLPVLGRPQSTATLADLASADVAVVLRADPTRTHPLVKTELVAATRRRGQTLILAQALASELGSLAAHDLRIHPASEAALLYGVARILAADGEVRSRAGDVLGLGEWLSGLSAYSLEATCAATGLGAAEIAAVADTLRTANSLVVVVITGHGIPGDEAGVARAAAELVVALGKAQQPGSGILIMGEKADVQGVVMAGLHPALLPGGRSAHDASARVVCSSLWGTPVPAGPGWPAREALRRSASGEVGVLYLVGRDPVDVWPRALAARAAVEGAGFVIVQDAFLTETARQADVVLPVAILLEREGTLVGADGERRPLRRAARPPASVPLDGQVFAEIASRLGVPLPDGEALERERAALLPWVDRGALGLGVPQPPSPAARGTGLLLDAAPHLFHSGSMTRHSRNLQDIAPTVSVGLAAEDAARLGVAGGETVSLVNGEQHILLRARIDRRIPAGQIAALWNSTSEGGGVLAPDDAAPTFVGVARSP